MHPVGLCGEDSLFLDALACAARPIAEIVFRAGTFEACVEQLTRTRAAVLIVAGPQPWGALERWAAELPFHPETHVIGIGRPPPGDLGTRWLEAGADAFLDDRVAGAEAIAETIDAVLRGQRWFPADSLSSSMRLRSGTRPPVLSMRERDVLTWLSTGADNLAIATLLGMSERTAKAHVSRLYVKLHCDNRTELAIRARQLGFRPDR